MDSSPEANVVLRGGPSSLAPCERVRHASNTTDKLKLLRGNHYDHFEPTAEIERRSGHELRVYVWMGCTYVAE